MPHLDFGTWAGLTAALIGLYFYIKSRISSGNVAELKAELEKAANAASNKDIDLYLEDLRKRVEKARAEYDKQKTDSGFLGPRDGNA